MTSAPAFFRETQPRVERALQQALAGEFDGPPAVRDAMRYTLLAPSKRVRAILTLVACDLCGGGNAEPAAAAVEMVHASSLILDDLPSMDDAPLRRGKPSCHVQYGEAVAVLAAFALLSDAFGVIAAAYDAPLARDLTARLARAIGSDGLIAGQAEDLLVTDTAIAFETLERIHRRKTGVLFSAAAAAGAAVAGASDEHLRALDTYARNLGLAFQIVDDLLDVTGDPAETGKAARADARKTTFVSFSGADGARQLAAELCRTADAALRPFGSRASPLLDLSAFVAGRRL
ncbi:MAG: polyprenyl synthetase family protein [Acidobacteriota bacterium]|nr:polyprenyl synthetase family protein [Acidobacteriota bacterium]